MKRVLVAGATGYLGRYVVKALNHSGYYIKVLVRDPNKMSQPDNYLAPSIVNDVDEIVVGDVTKPDTIKYICDDIDCVFSSVGITRQKDGLSFDDVDYQGNVNLLKEAELSHVSKFMYIHALTSDEWKEQGSMIDAKKRFVRELMDANVNHIVIRPTGYFSDLSQFLKMAKNGKVYLIGDGQMKMNPIHGEDIARFCIQSFTESNRTLDIGGPEVLTYEQIAQLAFAILNKREHIIHIPARILKPMSVGLKLFSKHNYGLFQFFMNVMTHDVIAPVYGEIKLRDYYNNIVS